MNKNKIQVEAIISDEQITKISDIIITAMGSKSSSSRGYKLLTKAETAEIFSISLRSLHNWNQAGILKPYSISNRIYYRSDEVEQALTQKQ